MYFNITELLVPKTKDFLFQAILKVPPTPQHYLELLKFTRLLEYLSPLKKTNQD